MSRIHSRLCGVAVALATGLAHAQASAPAPAAAKPEAKPAAPVVTTPVAAVKQDSARVPAAIAPTRAVEPKTAPALAAKPAVAAKKLARKSGKGKPRAARLAKAAPSPAPAVARQPASVSDDEVAVFSESTSFESLVKNRLQSARDPASFSPQARVVAVRRELGLNDDESNNAPQDIVLNSGTDNGLDEGMVLSVSRSVPVLDPYRENQQKQLDVEFAKIKIIHVQKDLAIARLERIDSIKSGLAVGTRAVLIGDYVGKFSR